MTPQDAAIVFGVIGAIFGALVMFVWLYVLDERQG